jgi:hypothetical protein
MENEEKRRHQRVKLPYVLKFRSLASNAPKNWDAVNPIDMSESGVCFLTVEQFIPGTDMFLLVANPTLGEERVYDCKVLRSEQAPDRSRFYKTVVTIENLDEETRKAYRKMLEAFGSTEKEKNI